MAICKTCGIELPRVACTRCGHVDMGDGPVVTFPSGMDSMFASEIETVIQGLSLDPYGDPEEWLEVNRARRRLQSRVACYRDAVADLRREEGDQI